MTLPAMGSRARPCLPVCRRYQDNRSPTVPPAPA